MPLPWGPALLKLPWFGKAAEASALESPPRRPLDLGAKMGNSRPCGPHGGQPGTQKNLGFLPETLWGNLPLRPPDRGGKCEVDSHLASPILPGISGVLLLLFRFGCCSRRQGLTKPRLASNSLYCKGGCELLILPCPPYKCRASEDCATISYAQCRGLNPGVLYETHLQPSLCPLLIIIPGRRLPRPPPR